MAVIEQLDDATFLARFENQSLSPIHFNHVGHLRLAWLYLAKWSTDEAIARICTGIQAYATSLGAKDKFHCTVTVAIVQIMAVREAASETSSWQLFLAQNPDLVEDAIGVLTQYYSRELLFSDAARLALVEPDLQPVE